MRNKLIFAVCTFIVLAILSSFPALSQTASPSHSILAASQQLLDLRKQVHTAGNDLSQIRKALSRLDQDRNIATALIEVSIHVQDRTLHALDVIWLYNSMSTAKDRKAVKGDVAKILEGLISSLEFEIETVNGELAHTKSVAIGGAGTELRSAIRKFIDVLKSLRL